MPSSQDLTSFRRKKIRLSRRGGGEKENERKDKFFFAWFC
jgi:hypothetical protein